MNTGSKITLPLDPNATWPAEGNSYWLRVKQGPNGLSLAGEGEVALGHLESSVAPDHINGSDHACVYLRKAGATHFAIPSEPLNAGDGFVGGPNGTVKKEADLSLAEGQVFEGGAAGSEITVTYNL